MKILIAEDCKYTQRIINIHLMKHGFKTIICDDGLLAQEELAKHDDIDLIISDIVMPQMDGLEFLQSVKDNPETKHIPFAIITGRNDAETVKNAVRLGCLGYIIKPINPGVMIETVRNILKLSDEWDLHSEKGIYTSRTWQR